MSAGPATGRDAGRWSDLAPRVASGLVMVALALGTAWAGGQLFTLFWLLAAAAILWEWQRLLGEAAERPRVVAGALALAVAAGLTLAGLWGASLLVTLAGTLVVGLLGRGGDWRMAAAGAAYAGALLLAVCVLRASFPGGFEAILWLFAVVWGTDVMAYFGGRLIGGPKLWRRLSPAKTWSGFLVGIGCGALAGLAVSPAGSAHGIVFVLGLLAGAAAQGGDLLESSIKRRYGVKDTSHLIPGHGGVMDRLDGFLVAAVLAALVGAAHAGLDAAGQGLFFWP